MKLFRLTRTYLVEAKNEAEAKETVQNAENEMDFFEDEWWEIAPIPTDDK